MLGFSSFIMEDRVDWLKSNVKSVPHEHDVNATVHEPHEIIDHWASTDPTSKKTYTQWAVNRYGKGDFRQEDQARVANALSNFDRYKGKLNKKDINQYKHLSDVEDAVQPHLGSASSGKEEKRQVKDEGADMVHSEPGLTVHAMKTHGAACAYGAGTKWCTAGKSPDMFNSYSKRGPLYVVQTKDPDGTNRKHQIHFPSNQFMDEKDRSIDPVKLVDKYPQLKNVSAFKGKHMAFDTDEELNKNIKAGHTYGPDTTKIKKAGHTYGPDTTKIKKFLANDSSGRLTADTVAGAHALHGARIEPEVFQHPNVGKDIIDHEISRPMNKANSLALLRNPKITPDQIATMHENMDKNTGHVSNAIATHPKTPPAILHSIAHRWKNNMEAADKAINNPNTHPDTFRSLHGTGLEIDAAMSMSPHTPHDVLQKLANHSNSFVASEAKENLAKMPEKKGFESI